MRRSPTSFAWPACVAAALLFSTSLASAQGVSPPPAIAPPPPMDPSTPGDNSVGNPSATTAKLDEAEREDSGRNFELFYVDTNLGASYINMSQFSSDTLSIEKASSAGPMVSLGAGVRLLVFVVGVRAKYNALSAFNMWQLNGEAGFKLPISQVDFLIGAHGGYSFVGNIGDGTVATNSGNTPTNNDAVKIRGWNAGLDVALDYYVTPLFSIGGGVFADVLFLNRPPVAIPSGLTPDQQAAVQSEPLYQKSGTSAGFQLGGGLRLGLHFGL